MRSVPHRRLPRIGAAFAVSGAVLAGAGAAAADTIGPIDFEPPAYALGTVNGQGGWQKTGSYDVAVAAVAGFPDASSFGFGTQALRISDAVTSGAFGDQTFSPGLTQPAGETTGRSHFEASFRIGSTSAAVQPGLHTTASPDDGQGSRMSYLRFEDRTDGIHVFFVDATWVTQPTPRSSFNETEIATLSRTRAHRVRFSMDLKPGPANDVVRVFVNGRLRITGTSWEEYYRNDSEQAGNGNIVPVVRKVLFRASGTPTPANAGQGFLVDGLRLGSSHPPYRKADCKRRGWTTRTRLDGTAFRNQGACVRWVAHHAKHLRAHPAKPHHPGRHPAKRQVRGHGPH